MSVQPQQLVKQSRARQCPEPWQVVSKAQCQLQGGKAASFWEVGKSIGAFQIKNRSAATNHLCNWQQSPQAALPQAASTAPICVLQFPPIRVSFSPRLLSQQLHRAWGCQHKKESDILREMSFLFQHCKTSTHLSQTCLPSRHPGISASVTHRVQLSTQEFIKLISLLICQFALLGSSRTTFLSPLTTRLRLLF